MPTPLSATALAAASAPAPAQPKQRIRVAVRVRPCRPHEQTTIRCEGGHSIFLGAGFPALPPGQPYSAVLGPESTQRDTFDRCGMPMVDALLSGQNACLFAYGQTGSGKTFSMLGAEGGRCPSKLDGIVPQIVAELFLRFAQLEKADEHRYFLWVSCIEVYDNKATDLLGPPMAGRPPPLEVRSAYLEGAEQRSQGAGVVGARRERVLSSRWLESDVHPV